MKWPSAVVAAFLLAGPAQAVLPGEQLANTRLEARARAISAYIRCVVCQNQSIDDSDAPLAHDLRVIVRERLVAGDSDAQATGYLVARYGHYVLLKPPVERATLLLWLGPAGFVLIGLAGLAAFITRGASRLATAPLDEAETARVEALLGRNEP